MKSKKPKKPKVEEKKQTAEEEVKKEEEQTEEELTGDAQGEKIKQEEEPVTQAKKEP